MRKNYKEKRIYVGDRTFLIEFWEDHEVNIVFPYVRVSEILTTSKTFFGKIKVRETKKELGKCWTTKSRVEWAMSVIERHFQGEKEAAEERQEVENFCK